MHEKLTQLCRSTSEPTPGPFDLAVNPPDRRVAAGRPGLQHLQAGGADCLSYYFTTPSRRVV